MDSREKGLVFLQKQFKNIKGEQKQKVKDILKLYKDGHIYSKATAQKEINNYLSYAKNPIERELRFYKTMTKYLSSAHSSKDKKLTKQINKNVDKIKELEIKHKVKIIKEKVIEKEFMIEVLLYSDIPIYTGQKVAHKRHDNKVYLLRKREFTVMAPYPFPSNIYRKLITNILDADEEKRKTGIAILSTDADFKHWYTTTSNSYLSAIYIKDYDSLDIKSDKKNIVH